MNRRPVVTFTIKNTQGQPLELSDLDPNSIRFTIAALSSEKTGESSYRNYLLTNVSGKDYVYKGETRKPVIGEISQPDFDHGGVLTRVRAGVFSYAFKTALPADYDRNATHVVGGEMTRESGKYVANPLYEFVPSGAKVKAQRAVVETATCNNCHDPLKYHGGTRQAAGYCALCHTSQLADPESGESFRVQGFCAQNPPR